MHAILKQCSQVLREKDLFSVCTVNKQKITLETTGAKDEISLCLPKNIWKQIIGLHSEVSISHSFISVINRG